MRYDFTPETEFAVRSAIEAAGEVITLVNKTEVDMQKLAQEGIKYHTICYFETAKATIPVRNPQALLAEADARILDLEYQLLLAQEGLTV